LGIVAGLGVAAFWPHEPIRAAATDRDTKDSKFVLTTVSVKDVTIAGVRDSLEGVFVLDILTGKLQGAVLNGKFGKFTNFYAKDVAADFQLDPQQEARYAIVSGNSQLAGGRGETPATGVIYVGELNTGKVIAYGFTFREVNRPVPALPLVVLDQFQFREPSQ
jgi:hypothetical protein